MEIRRADRADEEAILALATTTLGWGDDPRFRRLYRWKHDENPFDPSPRWVAVEQGEVVGFRVFLRWDLRRPDGSVARAVRAVDTATHPDHQGKGIFTRLTLHALDELADLGIDFVFNTPNDKSRPGYLKMGWVELGRPAVGVAPRLPGALRSVRAKQAAELWSEASDAGSAAGSFDGSWPASRSGRSTGMATDVSPAFLSWRYGLPELAYRVLTLGSDPAEGWAVFRTRRRGPALEAAVGELEAPDGRARRRLLRSILRESRADHALVRSTAPIDLAPTIRLDALSPVVTWRSVNQVDPPDIEAMALSVGDLELF